MTCEKLHLFILPFKKKQDSFFFFNESTLKILLLCDAEKNYYHGRT